MTKFNFSLRQLLVTVTFIAILLSTLVWLARHSPSFFVFAFLFTLPIVLLGLGVIFLAAIMLFSVYTSDDTDERKLNIAKCANLALIGALMIALPLLLTAIAAAVIGTVTCY